MKRIWVMMFPVMFCVTAQGQTPAPAPTALSLSDIDCCTDAWNAVSASRGDGGDRKIPSELDLSYSKDPSLLKDLANAGVLVQPYSYPLYEEIAHDQIVNGTALFRDYAYFCKPLIIEGEAYPASLLIFAATDSDPAWKKHAMYVMDNVNDATDIETAFEVHGATDGQVFFFAPGTYMLDQTVNVDWHRLRIEGGGAGTCFTRNATFTTGAVFKCREDTAEGANIGPSDLQFDNFRILGFDKTDTNANGIDVYTPGSGEFDRLKIENVQFHNLYQGIRWHDAALQGNLDNGLIANCNFVNIGDDAIELSDDQLAGSVLIRDCQFTNGAAYAVEAYGGYVHVHGCYVSGATIAFSGCDVIEDCYVTGCTGRCVNPKSDCLIQGNQFIGGTYAVYASGYQDELRFIGNYCTEQTSGGLWFGSLSGINYIQGNDFVDITGTYTIACGGDSRNMIIGNRFLSNSVTKELISTWDYHCGFGDSVFSNNYIAFSDATIVVHITYSPNKSIIDNNVIWDFNEGGDTGNIYGIDVFNSDGTVVTNNIIYEPDAAGTVYGMYFGHNLTANGSGINYTVDGNLCFGEGMDDPFTYKGSFGDVTFRLANIIDDKDQSREYLINAFKDLNNEADDYLIGMATIETVTGYALTVGRDAITGNSTYFGGAVNIAGEVTATTLVVSGTTYMTPTPQPTATPAVVLGSTWTYIETPTPGASAGYIVYVTLPTIVAGENVYVTGSSAPSWTINATNEFTPTPMNTPTPWGVTAGEAIYVTAPVGAATEFTLNADIPYTPTPPPTPVNTLPPATAMPVDMVTGAYVTPLATYQFALEWPGTPTPMPTSIVTGDYVTPIATYQFHVDPQPTADLSGYWLQQSGTANYLPKWTGTNTLGNSSIYDDGTNVGIGSTGPIRNLQVNGSIQGNQYLTFGEWTDEIFVNAQNELFYWTERGFDLTGSTTGGASIIDIENITKPHLGGGRFSRIQFTSPGDVIFTFTGHVFPIRYNGIWNTFVQIRAGQFPSAIKIEVQRQSDDAWIEAWNDTNPSFVQRLWVGSLVSVPTGDGTIPKGVRYTLSFSSTGICYLNSLGFVHRNTPLFYDVMPYLGDDNTFYGKIGIGTTPSYNLDVNGDARISGQFISTLATGTKPFSIASTTLNTNLNADMIDGYHASSFSSSSHNHDSSYLKLTGGILSGDINAASGYFSGDVSALSFTDRTQYPADSFDALSAIAAMRTKDATSGWGQLDHDSLPSALVRSTTYPEQKYQITNKLTADVAAEIPIRLVNNRTDVKDVKELLLAVKKEAALSKEITSYPDEFNLKLIDGERIEKGRDLGGAVSLNSKAIADLLKIVRDLEKKVAVLEERVKVLEVVK